jgi:hypothetical protein
MISMDKYVEGNPTGPKSKRRNLSTVIFRHHPARPAERTTTANWGLKTLRWETSVLI